MVDRENEKELIDYELAIMQSEVDHSESVAAALKRELEFNEDFDRQFNEAVSKRAGIIVTKDNEDSIKLPASVWGEIYDEIAEAQDRLIRPSHNLLRYSLMKKRPELKKFVPNQQTQSGFMGALQMLGDKSTSRATEIMKEFTSENTRMAQMGDLVYWQAWLSAIGFTFKTPITETEVITFIVQHAEGLDAEIDKKLVDQNFKAKLGPHKMATIKRRIASLSVFLEIAKWPNPTHSKDISQLLSKLTKKYGGSKPAGKAITKNILDDMLEACNGGKLIDIRDKAIFLFAWGSGGRRRSEVTTADMKDLVKTPENEYVYTIPKSKTDQEGVGHPVPVKGRAAKALTEWLAAANITEGPIFRSVLKGGRLGNALMPKDIRRFVKKRLNSAGYDDTQYGAHSLRSGFVTEAGRRNKNLGDVMQMTTHRNVNTVMKYYQAGSISNNSASNLAD